MATKTNQVKPNGSKNFVVVDGHKIPSAVDNKVREAITADIKSSATWRELAVPLVCAFWNLSMETPDSWPKELETDSDESKALYAYLLSRDPRMQDAPPARGDVTDKARAQRLARKDATALASTTRSNVLKYFREANTPDDDDGEVTPQKKKAGRLGFESWLTRAKADCTNRAESSKVTKESAELFRSMYALLAVIERTGPGAVLAMVQGAPELEALVPPMNPVKIAQKLGSDARKPGEVVTIDPVEYAEANSPL